MQERKLQEIKMQAAFAGVNLDDKKPKNKKDAEDRLKSPLKNFPDDIEYLSANDCDVKIRITNDPKLPLAMEQKWDSYRKDCCTGKYGRAPKRCSMNDVLWGRYLKSVEAGKPLIIDIIKIMVEFDMVRRELYPKDYKGHPEEPPPEEYLKELKSSGKYIGILQKLDNLSKRLQNYGTS